MFRIIVIISTAIKRRLQLAWNNWQRILVAATPRTRIEPLTHENVRIAALEAKIDFLERIVEQILDLTSAARISSSLRSQPISHTQHSITTATERKLSDDNNTLSNSKVVTETSSAYTPLTSMSFDPNIPTTRDAYIVIAFELRRLSLSLQEKEERESLFTARVFNCSFCLVMCMIASWHGTIISLRCRALILPCIYR